MWLQEQADTDLKMGMSIRTEWMLTAAHNRSLCSVVVVDLFCSDLLVMVISMVPVKGYLAL